MSVHAIPRTTVLRDWPSANRPRDQKESARKTTKFQALTRRNLDSISQYGNVTGDDLFAMKVVSAVLPFRTNRYVIEHLIDWDRVPDDPVYKLVFPQRGMLGDGDFRRIADLMVQGATPQEIERAAADIRANLNPHPAGQRELNIPREEGETFEGLQHKYRETILFFPSQGQTCHAYCTFCFRWAQFVGEKELKISTKDAVGLHRYLADHPRYFRRSVHGRRPDDHEDPGDGELPTGLHRRPGVGPRAEHPDRHQGAHLLAASLRQRTRMRTICCACWRRWSARAGTSRSWPTSTTGRRCGPTWCRTRSAASASTGAVIRSQAPLLAQINNDPDIWARMWREQVRLGVIPYYMFVERDTGPRHYFEVPLVRCWEVFRSAIQQVSGLGRTVRGPSMSATPGKVEVLGVQEVAGEKVFVLRFLQGRDPDWVGRPFFARFDPKATWLDQLEPAFGEDSFFFEDGLQALTA